VTVYVVQEVQGRNIASARQYGNFEVLLPSNTQIMLSASPSVRRMKSVLHDYKDGDYLLLMGDPAAIGVACSIAAFYNRGKYSILKWDRQEGLYYPVDIDLHQKGELNE
jgi:hypothetical protein|tara:strand:+ start:2351 stop:2677 length:327 start_codon:yes stop_codon:yes gene_type:complete